MLKNDLVLQNRWVIAANDYRIGDVVTLTCPVDPNRKITKRIIALEGDIVQTRSPYPEPTIRVPRGHCWIEGDEGFHSRDSNFYGPVPLGLLKERIEWVLYPFQRFGRVERQTRDSRVRYAPGHGSN
ncbi:hypothetical protein DFQ27_004552 [Actinomortierella ambigua]|uniref:Mitochondrial inner membrane protease subunit 2 n=1 Tax=Actinomortierella ambigua TaxID=1343610 RepID=A0A9P6U3X9_9FUNG|nr:hypothetical protein DFQ27_004552 [Actinomortierella ambigua]